MAYRRACSDPCVTRIQSIIRILTRRRLALARMRRLHERQRAGISIAPAPYSNDYALLHCICALMTQSGHATDKA